MVLLLYVVVCAAMAYVILDIARAPRSGIRVLSKPVWIALVLLFGLLFGPISCVLWFIFGRPRSAIGRGGARARREHPAYGGSGRWDAIPSHRSDGLGRARGRVHWLEQPDRPRGPDDDPEFLLELSERLRRQDPDGPSPRP
ncbi:hypothetical protein [Pseudofrankia asymbiotica]|nr:hypothetical protein [Pseudofrankia asymbiotica]